MAKRRRLTAPDASTLQELEEGFVAKPALGGALETKSAGPPIAQVAAEAASLNGMAAVTDRVALARDQGDAERLRQAEQAGLLVQKIAIDRIDQDFIRRDRMGKDDEAMAELVSSIRSHDLRSPIEVVETEEGYGLISGFRRLLAFRQLAASGQGFGEIAAFVRPAASGEMAYVSMVEENEIRANLSHYERGRIAVLAAGQGVFPSVEMAVDKLFSAASKAKRSKVRSFAVVHEALGDLLRFPTALTEKSGLQLAAALRGGAQVPLRAVLDGAEADDAKGEWALLQAALKGAGDTGRDTSRGGRPQQITRVPERSLAKGGVLRAEVTGDGLRIELKGRVVNADTAERLLQLIARQIG
ncbi:MAG: ParB N-terminal domain-containing protein [Rhodobacteraceae bacterium]|nr:ParB N-terminal domain-containing protein [Paracoccaceae bacterium]